MVFLADGAAAKGTELVSARGPEEAFFPGRTASGVVVLRLLSQRPPLYQLSNVSNEVLNE